jgi:antitoxin component YwqK of YwqJK toxin-antitoxin module
MKITLNKLKKLEVCRELCDWFKDDFGEEAEHTDVIKLLEDQKDSKCYIDFIFEGFKLSGAARSWRETGKLFCEINYKNGKLHGIAKYYYDNGKLFCEENYKDGKLHGIAKYYYNNGKLVTKRMWKNGDPIYENNIKEA